MERVQRDGKCERYTSQWSSSYDNTNAGSLPPTSPSRHIRYDISDQTVRRRLYQDGLHSRRPMRSFALNQRNCGNRSYWALAHQHWTVAEWRNVMFAGETRIGMRLDTRRVRVWCRWKCNVLGRNNDGTAVPLIPIYGTLTGPRYLRDCTALQT